MQPFNELKASLKNWKVLARGGQKLVYSAKHQKYGDVVVKLYFKLDDPRAIREIDIGQSYGFDFVPTIYENGYVDYEKVKTLYVIEQKINGYDLRKWLEQGNRFNLKKAVVFLEQSLNFICQIESKGIIHRDIKPENIMLAENDRIFFLDFGIARILGLPSLTQTEAVLGPHTPGYAAPEQFNNLKNSIDSRSDLFSVGIVTYECLTGENPFRSGARSVLEILQNTETITPVAHTIDGDTHHQFMALLSSLMGKYPSRRPKNARQALDWLNAAKPTFEYR